MRNQEIKFEDQVNDEIGLGRSRSEITNDILTGLLKEPPITIEEETILDELGLGKIPPISGVVEHDNEGKVDKQ